MKTSSAKAKGRRFQQLVASKISKLTGFACGPNEMIESRWMGQSGVDIRLVADALDAFPWSVECKCVEKLNWWDAIKQALSNTLPRTDWLLCVKRNRTHPVVVLDMDVFFDILDRLPGSRKGR